MNKIIFLIITLVFSSDLYSQNISVASFKSLPMDMDARVNYPKKDQNGEVCALIKVVTTQTGFIWEPDGLGIVSAEPKAGEFWLYVPHGAKRITIKHAQLGLLRDYFYPLPIEKSTVYEMVLVSGKVISEVIPVDPVWLTIRSIPDGADTYIDDVLKGATPFPLKLLPGKHTYRIEKSLYHSAAGNIEITGQEKDGKKDLPVNLKPAFGSIRINTLPEQGASVILDNTETGKTTPFSMTTVNSGIHRITVKKEFFQPKSIEVTVKDGEITEKTITLSSNAANVSISAQNDADIYIDGQYVAKGNYQGKIPAGVVTFEAKKEDYYPDKQNKDIAVGESVIINLIIHPRVGSADIESNPMDATVYINGEPKGITPITVKNLMIGNYELKIEKEGFYGIVKDIAISENKTTEVKEKLVSSQKKTIQAENTTPKKEVKKQEPFPTTETPIYNADYYKYKKKKNSWLVSTIVGAGIGTFAYLQAGNYYEQYKTATTGAEDLYQKAEMYNTIAPIFLGVAGLSSILFLTNAGKQSKARKQTIGFYPQLLHEGAGVAMVYNF